MATNYMVVKNGLIVQGPISASFAATTASWAQNITSSGVLGTVANATNAGTANTSSYISSSAIFDRLTQNIYQFTASQAISASWAPSAGLTPGSTQPITSSWAQTASVAVVAVSITSSGVSGTVANATNAGFAGQAVQATSSLSASYVLGANVVSAVLNATNSLFAQQAVQATSSLSASYVLGANVVSAVLNATNSLFAQQAVQATSSLSASYVTASNVVGIVANATSASYAGTSSILNGFNFTNASVTLTANTASAVITVLTSSYISAFFDYAAVSQSNIRAGTVFGSWLTNGSLTYTEMTNVDVGNTQDVTMSLGLGTSGTVQLSASSVTFNNWTVRALGRFI